MRGLASPFDGISSPFPRRGLITIPPPLPDTGGVGVTPRSLVRSFDWTNSLRNLAVGAAPGADADTQIARWTGAMATEAGLTLENAGQFGFINAGWTRPPTSNFDYAGVADIDLDGTWAGFRAANFNFITFVPDNFRRGDNLGINDPFEGASYVTRLLAFIDDVAANSNELPVFVISDGPPYMDPWPALDPEGGAWTPAAWTAWKAYARGAHHQWGVDLVAALQAARPALTILHQPHAKVLMDIYDQVLPSLTPLDLYVDNAPHGNQNAYFLGAMINFQFRFRQRCPAGFNAFSDVSQTIVDAYAALTDFVWDQLFGTAQPVPTGTWDISPLDGGLRINDRPGVPAPGVPQLMAGDGSITITGYA